jgi:hypothetical protein
MGTDDWNTVEAAVSRIRQIESNVAKAERAAPLAQLMGRVEESLGAEAVASLRAVRRDAQHAYDALAQLADGPPADETFGASLQGNAQAPSSLDDQS